MSREQPYNSLGQILAQGGDIALGLAISHGWTSAQINALFDRRFSPMTADDRNELMRRAQAGVDAARALENRPLDSLIGPQSLPTNPELFGSDPEGNRLIVIGDVEFEESGRKFEIRIQFSDLPSIVELYQQFAEEAKRRAKMCIPDFRDIEQDDISGFNVTLHFGAKRF